ncbi:MAG: hypothetical protein ABIP42_15665, partial [Planctomycetota bacterium]
ILVMGCNGAPGCDLPQPPPGLTYVDLRDGYPSMALRSDGKIVTSNQAVGTPLAPPPGTSFCQILSGNMLFGLLSNGTVCKWNPASGFTYPLASTGKKYVAIATVGFSATTVFALRTDGLIDSTSPSLLPPPPPGTVYSNIAGGAYLQAAIFTDVVQPRTYCTAKVNSLGCTPSMTWQGVSSAGQTSGFQVIGSPIRCRKPGVLLYSLNGAQAIPVFGGTLCIRSPISISPQVASHGELWPTDTCSGTWSIDMNAFAAGGLGGPPIPALRIPGTRVNCQFLGRDTSFPNFYQYALTNALEYVIGL